jgi:hypothetical protein
VDRIRRTIGKSDCRWTGEKNVAWQTYNLKHFPAAPLALYGIEAQHPDDFITHLLDLGPGAVCAAVKRQREMLRKPPKSAEELLTNFESMGLTQTAARLRGFIDLL